MKCDSRIYLLENVSAKPGFMVLDPLGIHRECYRGAGYLVCCHEPFGPCTVIVRPGPSSHQHVGHIPDFCG